MLQADVQGPATGAGASHRTPSKPGPTAHKPAVSLFMSPIKADELDLNPKWSPCSPSPRSKKLFTATTEAARQKRIIADMVYGTGDVERDPETATATAPAGDSGAIFSPFARRHNNPALAALRSPQRLLLSPKSIPPLSPVLSSKKSKPFLLDRLDTGRFQQYSSPLSRVSPVSAGDIYDLPSPSFTAGDTDLEHSPTASRVAAGLKAGESLHPLVAEPDAGHLSSPLGPNRSTFTATPDAKKSSVCRSLFDSGMRPPASPRREPATAKSEPAAAPSPSTRRTNRELFELRTPTTRRHGGLPRLTSSELLAGTPSAKLARTEGATSVATIPPALPQFYFATVTPDQAAELTVLADRHVREARYALADDFGVNPTDFVPVTALCGLPRFTNLALFRRVIGDHSTEPSEPTAARTRPHLAHRRRSRPGRHTHQQFARVWHPLRTVSPDDAALVFNLLRQPDHAWLEPEDFLVVAEDVIDNHPELEFLRGLDVFKERYAETVVERIFYLAARGSDRRITLAQFRRHELHRLLAELEIGIDVGIDEPRCFSYKHFYVIYCNFWELDSDHDMLIDLNDLLRYHENAVSERVLHRVLEGRGKPSALDAPARPTPPTGPPASPHSIAFPVGQPTARYPYRMTYRDFIWFILSEEDKTTPTAIEYWFRCLDLDSDGQITVYELEYFFREQVERMEMLSGEVVNFDDCVCQIMDMIRPRTPGIITLRDLQRSPYPAPVIDMFVNFGKFVEYENKHQVLQQMLLQVALQAPRGTDQRSLIAFKDQFLSSMPSDWVEYADTEYENLLAKESADEQQTQQVDDDEEEEMSAQHQSVSSVGESEDLSDFDDISDNHHRDEAMAQTRVEGSEEDGTTAANMLIDSHRRGLASDVEFSDSDDTPFPPQFYTSADAGRGASLPGSPGSSSPTHRLRRSRRRSGTHEQLATAPIELSPAAGELTSDLNRCVSSFDAGSTDGFDEDEDERDQPQMSPYEPDHSVLLSSPSHGSRRNPADHLASPTTSSPIPAVRTTCLSPGARF